ncbi:uncharacterized protein tasor2 isoform X2 [Larimichthys crocea]|uniref:uncharacterized protein tasor2 isoform X2 n=1 Tax=Larimichthys crocea TaxID=215358 RepID=UPI000F5E9365|nr:uncharacterized protein LOC104940645 isoform X2 [Larimichthys crocea]
MESGNGGASSKGVLVPVSPTSDTFQNKVLAPLKSAYLYEESKQFFRYKSAVLIKNAELEKKYDDFRAKRREAGYSEEDLKESYGFLLFDDANKANTLGETGVLTGNSTCTTLGDPSHGVYISMYSDCLDLNRWYHGKSGYIVIIRLTKGRVKKVSENYTQNFTAPTEGFDCHVSEQLPSVSAKTSSFLAFERTQYYMYELLNDGSNKTAESPSAACPFATVSFSYTDTKAALEAPQEKSEEKKSVCHYFPWRGQLQIDTHFYNVALRSTTGGSIPAELPPVVKIERATSMLDLRKLLPRAIFETCFSGEIFLDGLYCSLCELVSSEADETSSLSSLLWEIKEKDVALTIPLNDGGFLILLHSSHFLRYDDTGSSASEVLQGMFVFPDSRTIYADAKSGQRKPAMSSEILRVLPVLNYAEGEVEKTTIDPSEELCEVFMQHMHNYATLINPGLALSPSRDFSIFPDQYDVPDAHKHLYSSPEWTNRAWQTMRSYLNKPVSFQLPVPKVSEILAAGQEERIEDLDDDVYICLSSPEEAPANHVGMESEEEGVGQKSSENVETFVDRCVTNAEAEGDLTEPTDVLPDDLQSGDATKDSEKSDLTVLIKTDMGTKNLLTPSTSGDLPTELIVSITSAERTVTDESLISTESAPKHNDFELSVFSTAKLEETGMNSLNDETAKTIKDVDYPEVNNLTKTKHRKPHRGHYKARKHILKACIETSSLHTVTTPLEEDNMKSQKEDQANESSGHPQLSNPPKIDWRKVRKRKRIFGKLSSKNKKVRSATVGPAVAEEKSSDPGQQSFEGTILKELEACPLRKKTERWDLKPVTSECGRILVPHGSVDFADQIKSLKDKIQSTKDEQLPEKMLVDATVSVHDTVEMEQKSSAASETAVDETVATTSKSEGNHVPNIVLSHVNLEPGILRQSYDGNGSLTLNPVSSEHSSTNDGTDTPPLKPVQEKHTDAPSPVKSATKGEFLLSKLKSVLQRGKRKTGIPVPEETTANTAQETEPCLKKSKVDSNSGMLKGLDAITTVQETGLDFKDVSKMLSVDPVFAYALGLTPKETPDKIQTSEGQDTQQKKESSVTEEQFISDKPQIIQRPLSIFPRRSRIKTLKKHQGIPAEYVKKKCAPFQVSPLSGSTRLLHHHQTMYGNGFKTLHLSVDQEDRTEYNRTPDYLKKYRRQFRLSRTFDNKDGSIQVTKQWKDNYDFNLDSKYTSDSKDRAIIRALHGPWDFSIQDTSEEVRLIVHMWIGLFYSRTTDRFFHVDSNSANSFSEESDSLEIQSSGMVAAPAQSELKTNSPSLNVMDTKDTSISKALDLSKKDNSVLDQESVILDLSLRNSNAEIVTSDPRVNKRETSVSDQQREASETLNTPKTSMEQQKYSRKWILLTDIITKVNATSEKVTPLEHSVLPALKGVGPFSSAQEEIKSVSVQPKKHQTASGIGHVLDEFYNEKTHVTDWIVNSEATEMSLVQKQGRDSSISVTDKEVYANKKGFDLVHTVEHVEIESKHMENLKVKEKPYQEGNVEPSPKMIHTGDDSAKKESGIVCNGSLLESEKQLSREEHKAVPLGKAENVHEDVDCCTEHEDNVTTADSSGKEDGLGVKDISDVEASSALNDQLLPMMCNDPSSVKKDCISECNGQAPLDKQPPQADNKEDGCHDLQLRTLCANGSGMMDEHVFEKAPCVPSNMEPIPNETVVEEISENVCLTDLHDQPLPMTYGPDLEKKDCTAECNRQAPLDEQPSQADNKEDDCHDSQLRALCATDRALTDEHVSEKAPCAPSELDHISNETVVEEISENVCLADLSDQSLPMTYDGPDLEKKDCTAECNRQGPLDEQPSQADNKEDDCHDSWLRVLCATDRALTDEHVSEKAPCAPSELEPISNEPALEEISENVCLADLCDQSLPMTYDGPDLEKKDCTAECNRQAPLDEQPPQADNKEDDCHDSWLRVLCATDRALTDEHVSEKAPCAPSELEPISNEPALEEISENVCLADLSDEPLPMTYDSPDLERKDCMTECNRQAPLDEQPSQADNKEDDCHDSQLRVLCATDKALRDEHVSEKAPCAPSELEPISNEPALEEISENVCLADLSDELLPMTNDGPDLVKKDCMMEFNRQTPLDKQPPQANNKEDACHDLQLRTACVTNRAVRDEHLSERNHYVSSEMKPIHDEPAVKEISENVGLADLSDQPLPLTNDGPDFVKKDCITDCSDQAPPVDEQPPQADNKEVSCYDFQLRKLCEPVVEENKENYICLADKAHQKAALPISDESTCLDESSADGPLPQVNASVETGGQNKLMANFSLSNDDHKDQDTSFQGEQSVDNTIQKELFYHQPHCGAEVALSKEIDLKSDATNKGLEKIHNRVVIPFIGEDISEDEVQPCESHSEHKVEKVQTSSGLTEIPFIGETTHPETVLSTDLRSTSQLYSKKVEMSAGKIPLSLFNVSETNQPEVSGSESDDRCPTPTMDEKPYQYVTSSGPSSSSSTTFNGIEIWENINQKRLSKSAKSIPDEMALDQKQKSTVNSDPIPHRGLHPDLELRTLRVLQSIDKFFSKSSHTNKPSQIQTAEMKRSLDQTSNISTKYSPACFTPSHTSVDFKDKKTSNAKPVVVSASTSQHLNTQSPGHFLISPIKSKLEDLLGVRLQLNHTDSSVNHHYFEKREELQENAVRKDCYPQRPLPSTECVQAIKPDIDQDGHKLTSQTNSGHEPRSYCQRPVMAVKPSKSDEIQAESICKDSEDSVMSKFFKDKQTKTPIVTYATPASMFLEKKTESLNEDKQEFSAVLDPLYLYEGRDFSKFNKIPSSSFPVQPFESAKTFSKLVDVSQNVLTNSLVETVGKSSKENNEMDQKDYLGISTLVADYKDDTIIDDSLILGPQSSLTCTVYNTRQKRSDTFLEQLSKRCLQEDLTQATLEQECLIFSEQMKQLLKKRSTHQQDTRDNLNLSCSSPVTVQFSSLEEQGDSIDLFDVDEPSLVGHKIKVDMSDRKQPAETTEESTSHPQKSSQRTGNPMEHTGVSVVTAECATLYTALMNDVCTVAKDPSRSKHLRTIRGVIKTEPINHFDFCDQMKREMDESFRSNLNSIVKKSCKTKYRFYTLVTSDDTFFEQTKAQLEAEGHTAVEPSEFFLSEDTSSSLLIILRNEDIAEHICEVPHLLELKKSPSVQFAGIDEPDDVVNLTHQELFMRGGFIMFDRATLESLSLSNMKKMSEILQELSRTGKWKWMLHYRDSRWIKENARLSAEAKEKKHFLNWCHEVGLLEVLPYHECDLMSKDQPDYLTCLVRLQVQNISARYPVFITDTTDSAFGTNGILTMTLSSFLTCSLSETFAV